MAATDKDQALRKIQEKIKSVSDYLAQLTNQQSDMTAELKHLEQQQGKLAHTVQQLNNEAQQIKQHIDEIHQEIQLQNGLLLMQQSELAGLVKSAYALGRQEQLKLFFNQQDMSRSSRMMKYYHYFNQAKLNKLSQASTSLQRLNKLDQEQQLEKQKLASIIAQYKQQQQQLTQNKTKRKEILARLKQEHQQNTSQLTNLKHEALQLKQLINKLQKTPQQPTKKTTESKPFRQLQGKLPWPAPGKIAQSFASPRASGKWNGILIQASEGTKIQAIARGQVVFSNWFKGYGLLIIIKHDKNYMSLYAFNQSLYKKVGDWVNTGDTVATMGNSGGREEPGLYFEIRKKNQPLDPVKWCKKRR